MAGIIQKMKEKFQKMSGKMESYQEAITFAEAGHAEYAREFAPQEVEKEPNILLVIGSDGAFSTEIIDYALEMAKRMAYEIVALSTAPFSCDTFKMFSSSRDKLCADFKELSEKNASLFQEAAVKADVPFSHVVKFSEVEEATEAVRKEVGEIAFVVSESVEQQVEDRAAEGKRLQQKLFVYSVV